MAGKRKEQVTGGWGRKKQWVIEIKNPWTGGLGDEHYRPGWL